MGQPHSEMTPLMPPLHSWLILALLMTLGTVPALAQEESHLKLKAETSLSNDSNLFRLPSGLDPVIVLGKSSASEQISVTTLGLNFSTTLSLQRIDLAVSLVNSAYKNFDYLNNLSYNYNAALHWSLTPSLNGNFISDRKENANSFSDYLGLQQSNLRTETSTRLDAVYEVDGPWRILGGVSQFNQANQQVLLAGGDYTTNAAEAGVGYVFGTGSSATFTQKAISGQYLNRILPSIGLYDDTFNQAISDLRFHWVLINNSSADFYLSHLNQTHPNYPERDFSAMNSGASLNWLLTGKSALTLALSREFSSYATANTNYSQTDRISLSPSLQISPKSVVRLRHDWSRINYLGSPTGVATSQRSDITRDTALSFYWQPEQRLTLSASLQNAIRNSNQTGLDYDSNQISISAQYSY
jgi:exopolysaccharide biosynthesis operon protein EpsL